MTRKPLFPLAICAVIGLCTATFTSLASSPNKKVGLRTSDPKGDGHEVIKLDIPGQQPGRVIDVPIDGPGGEDRSDDDDYTPASNKEEKAIAIVAGINAQVNNDRVVASYLGNGDISIVWLDDTGNWVPLYGFTWRSGTKETHDYIRQSDLTPGWPYPWPEELWPFPYPPPEGPWWLYGWFGFATFDLDGSVTGFDCDGLPAVLNIGVGDNIVTLNTMAFASTEELMLEVEYTLAAMGLPLSIGPNGELVAELDYHDVMLGTNDVGLDHIIGWRQTQDGTPPMPDDD